MFRLQIRFVQTKGWGPGKARRSAAAAELIEIQNHRLFDTEWEHQKKTKTKMDNLS